VQAGIRHVLDAHFWSETRPLVPGRAALGGGNFRIMRQQGVLVAFVFLSGLVSPEYCRILRWGGEQRRDFHIYGDGRADSGRIYDFLNARSPSRVFRDIASLEPGVPWREVVERISR
jgi:hypothetical protein